ncbi:restriction endonuclease [Neptuniibacter sp. QD37_11]|uniref:restriction endonuclease n=1 Tax=Neptuniibacter sp. QD37_11 TaxID=3398209 RepID=UPI0039F4B3BA
MSWQEFFSTHTAKLIELTPILQDFAAELLLIPGATEGLIISILALLAFLWKRGGKKSHRWRIRQAKRVYKKIQKIHKQRGEAAVFQYVRKIDPFVFEELILIAIAAKGGKIKRNKRYTGDGGIDGQCWINRKHYLIQAKRYSGYIKGSHLNDFDTIVRKRRTRGLFIHTGKSGRHESSKVVTIISGQKILWLLLERITLNDLL